MKHLERRETPEVNFAGRLRILAKSWATANNKQQDDMGAIVEEDKCLRVHVCVCACVCVCGRTRVRMCIRICFCV